MAVTRDDIVAAAMALLDEDGLAGLTLRRLAGRLGIRAPTLYWHVRDKRELLDLMADAIMNEALAGWREPQPGQPWWEWLAQRARAQRAGLLAHRDGALVVSGNRPTAQSLPGIELQLRALAAAGFPPAEALLALLDLSAYVLGEALDTQAEADRGMQQPAPDTGREQALAAGPYPTLMAAATAISSPDARFEHGLQMMITGLRARLGELTGHRPS
jgi:TetR/AcrR family transcriptional regulator, tetracycline repressor protein